MRISYIIYRFSNKQIVIDIHQILKSSG